MIRRNPRLRNFETINQYVSSPRFGNAILAEVAWEVANQVGGIHTVIRSKVPSIKSKWGDNYVLIGPFIQPAVNAIFDPIDPSPDTAVGRAVIRMREMGYEVRYGTWLISGRPQVVLFNPFQVYNRLGEIKYYLWEHHAIGTPGQHELIDKVAAFGFLVRVFITELARPEVLGDQRLVTHVHEWMAATCIPGLRRDAVNTRIVFTTHATLLGRYLAGNDPEFYDHLAFVDWEKECKHFNIETETRIERAAAHGAHVFTTVSEVTGEECIHLLGKKPDVILPNGLNISRFVATHEIQNLHQEFKEQVHKFVMGHFFASTPFNLDKTLYFFTSGRYEYRNKGFDITLEALARLNWRLKQAKTDITVVMFFVTKADYHSMNPDVLQSRAMLEEIQLTCEAIEQQVGARLYLNMAQSNNAKLPDLNQFVDDYWRLRLRRAVQSWKRPDLPPIVTHNLVDDLKDPILEFLRSSQLINKADDPVKIVYHPDFISSTNPLFGIDYTEFVRACHLGIFPSYYEPWGYTPLECIASGVPAVTSDLSGFGDYCLQNLKDMENRGIYVVRRNNRSYHQAADQLADMLFNFVQLTRRERIELRNTVERASIDFDWSALTYQYDRAYEQALS